MMLALVPTLMVALSTAASPGAFAIMRTGQHHGSEVRGKTGGVWLGLFAKELRLVKVVSTPVADPLLDEDKPSARPSGLLVSTADAEAPRFLLRGLAPRPVSPVLAEQRPLGAFEPVELLMGRARSVVVAEKSGALGARLVLRSGSKEQVLYRHAAGDTDSWSLWWAGDLDGDGRLDLILSASRHDNVETTRLFLSSQARPGELVHEVAVLEMTGC